MSNLGLQIIYREVNERQDTQCERFFLPNREDWPEYVRTNTPLLSMEHQKPLYEFELIGVAMTFEMDYFHLTDLLALGRIPLVAADRGDQDSLVILGGACATFNPEPLFLFVDVCIIGEGEETIHRLLDTYYAVKASGANRQELLIALAQVSGLYVPSLYTHRYDEQGTLVEIIPDSRVPARVSRQWNELNRPGETVVATPYTEFGAMYLIEIARGCGRHCRFCMAGYCYRRPRVRSLDSIKEAVLRGKAHGKKIGLMGAAISDYPEIDELVEFIRNEGLPFSCASLRADSITKTIVQGLVESGQKTITLAPEAGSADMRSVINKGISDEDLYHSIDLAAAAGIKHVRLYIMVGLPWETEEDIDAIIAMTEDVRHYMDQKECRGRLTLSVNPFIPKPLTPFQWLPMTDKKTVDTRLGRITKTFRKDSRIEVRCESTKESYIQGVLARGDRRISEVLLKAHDYGGTGGWKRALKELKINGDTYLYQNRPIDSILPWQVLDMGLAPGYLADELAAAEKRAYTLPCFPGCTRCRVCGGKP